MSIRQAGSGYGKQNKGEVQLFFEQHGGTEFIRSLADRCKIPSSIVHYLADKYDFTCTGQSIRNIMKWYDIPRTGRGRNGGRNGGRHSWKAHKHSNNGRVIQPLKTKYKQVCTVIPGEMYNKEQWNALVAEARRKAKRN